MIPYLSGALLALAGGAFSFYFHGVYSGKLSAGEWWIPTFCRMDAESCTSIVDTPFGRLFGQPNSFYGLWFFPVYFLTLLFTAHGHVDPLIPLALALITVLAGMYLTYGLFRLKVVCPVCLSVHTINLLNFVMQLWAFTS